jgi:hypothetical protein
MYPWKNSTEDMKQGANINRKRRRIFSRKVKKKNKKWFPMQNGRVSTQIEPDLDPG